MFFNAPASGKPSRLRSTQLKTPTLHTARTPPRLPLLSLVGGRMRFMLREAFRFIRSAPGDLLCSRSARASSRRGVFPVTLRELVGIRSRSKASGADSNISQNVPEKTPRRSCTLTPNSPRDKVPALCDRSSPELARNTSTKLPALGILTAGTPGKGPTCAPSTTPASPPPS